MQRSLLKTVQDFKRITAGRHPGSPGQNATAAVPHSAPPADRPHIRADTQTEVNLHYELGKSNELDKVDEIVPNRERSAMEPEPLTLHNRRDHKNGQWDTVASYQIPGGWWHHAAEQKTDIGHPDNRMAFIHHTISSSPDPFDAKGVAASMYGTKDMYGTDVDETAVDKNRRKQGHGSALYRYATMHHGKINSGDSISKAANHLYHTFLRDPNFEVNISDVGSEDRHSLKYNGKKPTPTKVWQNPKLGKSDPLEKAMPRFAGEVDPEKEYVAVPHPQNPKALVWQHQPAKSKSFQSRIDQNIDKFTSQFGEHGPALKAGLQRVLANKKHADLVPTSMKAGDPHMPRRRHVAYLVSGDPASAIKHMGNGEFLWRQERHGSGNRIEHTWWKVNHQGVQDVTKQHEESPQDFFKKSDKPASTGDRDERATAKDPHDGRPEVLGSHGEGAGPVARADDAGAASPGVDDARSGGPGGQSGRTGRSPAKAGSRVRMFFYAGHKTGYWPPETATDVKPARVRGTLYVDKADGFFKDGYPRSNPTWVKGQIMWVDRDELREINKEETESGYKPVATVTEDGERAYVYEWQGQPPPDAVVADEWNVKLAKSIDASRALANVRIRHGKDPATGKVLPIEQGETLNTPFSGGIPEVATIAIIDPIAGAILMGRRSDTGLWTFPGGHLNRGETPHDGALREGREEMGTAFKALTYLGSEQVSGRDGKVRIIHCFAHFGRTTATSKFDPDKEVGQWYWVNIENNRLPDAVMHNLHSPKNVLLKLLGFMS